MHALALALLFSSTALSQEAPDRETAILLSVAVGFGSGHFYVGNDGAGVLYLLTQAAGIGAGLSCQVAAANQAADPARTADLFTGAAIAWGLTGVSRIAEVLTVIPSSERVSLEAYNDQAEAERRVATVTSPSYQRALADTTMDVALQAMGRNGTGTPELRRAIQAWLDAGYLPSSIIAAAARGMELMPQDSESSAVIEAGLRALTAE